MERRGISWGTVFAFGATIAAVVAGGMAGTRSVEEREAAARARFEQMVVDSCVRVREPRDRAVCEEYVRADQTPGFARAD